MPDRSTLRKLRMANEYQRLMQMSKPGGIMEITGNNGPASDHYTVLFRIPTIVGVDADGKPVYRDVSTVDIILPPEYPKRPPVSYMRDQPPWHPNWYQSGQWDSGTYSSEFEPLWDYVKRMAETIRFHPTFTNPDCPSNRAAAAFWAAPENKQYFPTCDMPLPEPAPQGERNITIIRRI